MSSTVLIHQLPGRDLFYLAFSFEYQAIIHEGWDLIFKKDYIFCRGQFLSGLFRLGQELTATKKIILFKK